MEVLLGTLFWAFTDPFIAFMGVMVGVLVVDKKTRFGAAFMIALVYELITVFLVGARGFDLNLFSMNILAAFGWALGAAYLAARIRQRRENQ